MRAGKATCLALFALAVLPAIAAAYNSEEHKLLVDMAAALLRIDPAISLPAPTSFGPVDPAQLLAIHKAAKTLAVGYDSNDQAQYSDKRHKVQDNSYWYGYGQRAYNFKIYVPPATDLRSTGLQVAARTAGALETYTIGELVALYGDYRKTTFCQTGDCFLTDASTPTLSFTLGTDCFNFGFDCGYRPNPITMRTYLKYIANGLTPPFGSKGNATGNTAGDTQYDDAGWWGDEMLRIANINDWHFSSAAVAWYVGMHRLALHYVDLARGDARYWNQALHCEASALHSYTDLFAFGHVITCRDRTSYGILGEKGLRNTSAAKWMANTTAMGGGVRMANGDVRLSSVFPAIADVPSEHDDFMPSYAGTWSFYAVQEKDFHDAFNQDGGWVRNLKGDLYFINGDGRFRSTDSTARSVIVEGVRTSLQSLFDAFVSLSSGATVAQLGAPGSVYFAALKSLPVYVDKNPPTRFSDSYGITWTIGNNFMGQWLPYSAAMDSIAGTHVVPAEPCVIQRVDGAIEFSALTTRTTACQAFPDISSPPPPPPPPPAVSSVHLAQNEPNPFTTNTLFRFELPQPAHVRLEIIDLHGSVIRTLVDETRPAGPGTVTWDLAAPGPDVRSGLYIYRLTVDGETFARKLAVVR